MAAPDNASFAAALADMNKFQASGMRPFCGSAKDISCELMECTHALLETLEAGWRTAADVSGGSDLSGLNPYIHAKALSGVATLTALALYFGEQA